MSDTNDTTGNGQVIEDDPISRAARSARRSSRWDATRTGTHSRTRTTWPTLAAQYEGLEGTAHPPQTR